MWVGLGRWFCVCMRWIYQIVLRTGVAVGGQKASKGAIPSELVSNISRATRAARIAFASQIRRNGKNKDTCNTILRV